MVDPAVRHGDERGGRDPESDSSTAGAGDGRGQPGPLSRGHAACLPLLEQARRISPARFDADYSYLATRMAGDRWVAVGDAAAFLDPIFSTGVLLAMQGGLEAAEAVDVGLRAGDLSARAFTRYERIVRKRYHHFRRFAVGFYDPAFRELWFTPRKPIRHATPRSWPSSPGTGGLHCRPGPGSSCSSPWSPCGVSPRGSGVLDARDTAR